MPQITIGLGMLLILLGLAGYFGGGQASITALIPAVFGALFLASGLVAFSERLRMHAMHGASLLALFGLIGAMVRPVRKLLAGELQFSTALASQVTMAVLCGVFLFLCVKSFVDARLRRKRAPADGD